MEPRNFCGELLEAARQFADGRNGLFPRGRTAAPEKTHPAQPRSGILRPGLRVGGLPLVSCTIGACAESADGRCTSVDLLAPRGQVVMSVSQGRVVYSAARGGLGACVAVLHADGHVSRYAHLDERHVAVDARVERGQPIGRVGNTGNARDPALRFDVIWRRRYCDPLDYLLALGCLGIA